MSLHGSSLGTEIDHHIFCSMLKSAMIKSCCKPFEIKEELTARLRTQTFSWPIATPEFACVVVGARAKDMTKWMPG